MDKNKLQALISAALAALCAQLGILAVPMLILVLFNLTDYATGLYAAHCRGEQVTSKRGLHGIAKKVCMWLLVAVGVGMDQLLVSAGSLMGMSSTPPRLLIASLVAVWLVCNEALSILENISHIGVPLPPFLAQISLWIKAQSEHAAPLPKKPGTEVKK